MKAIRITAKTDNGKQALLNWLNFGKNLSWSKRKRIEVARGMSNYKLNTISEEPLIVEYSDKFIGLLSKTIHTRQAHLNSVLQILKAPEFGAKEGDVELEYT